VWSTRSSNPMAMPSNTSWNDRAITANRPRNDCPTGLLKFLEECLSASPPSHITCRRSAPGLLGSAISWKIGRYRSSLDSFMCSLTTEVAGGSVGVCKVGGLDDGVRRLRLIDRCSTSSLGSLSSYQLSSTVCTTWSIINTRKNPEQKIRSPRFSKPWKSNSWPSYCKWVIASRTSGCRCKRVVNSNTPPPKHNSRETSGEKSVAESPGCEWTPVCRGGSPFGYQHFLVMNFMGNTPSTNEPTPRTNMAIVLTTTICPKNDDAPTSIPSSAIWLCLVYSWDMPLHCTRRINAYRTCSKINSNK